MKAVEGSFLSVDGTDFLINEPKLFNNCWYSHKFRGPGLRYKVGVSIQFPKIVWASGPWPCGSYSDVRVFCEGLKKNLRLDEFVIADNGYTDERCIPYHFITIFFAVLHISQLILDDEPLFHIQIE